MKIFKSFACALRGIVHCIKNERNMRFHTVVAFYVLILSYIFELSYEKVSIVLLTISAVLTTEMVNTVVEELADMAVDDYNMSVRIIKDISAGAVMVSAIFSVAIGIIMFHDVKYYMKIFHFFWNCPFSFLLFGIMVLISYFYVELGPNQIKRMLIKFKFRSK